MINLRNRTEFSFRNAFGTIPAVLDAPQGEAAGIADRGGTWGHVQWQHHCKKRGIKPIFGVELAVVNDMDSREKQPTNYMAFIAKHKKGLQEIYELVTLATEKFYYEPRIDYSVLKSISELVVVLSGTNPNWDRLPDRLNMYVELNGSSQPDAMNMAIRKGLPIIATSDNTWAKPGDRAAYEMIAGRNINIKSSPQHILSEWEWSMHGHDKQALSNARSCAESCNVTLTEATMVKPQKPQPLRTMCEEAAPRRKIDLTDPVYKARLDRELDLIDTKQFEDYFYVVADMCKYAKQHMLVGPARGSSCGSLVCYLLEITEIDPIPYSLLFERFIDINRSDLPDIDIDFPDDRRDMVFDYLRQKYGAECVARLGTVARFKPKSTITDVGKALRIPAWELEDLKGSMIERSSGDSRAGFCILDTFEEFVAGQRALEKYPEIRVAADIEGHARQSGQHACGILVTADPVRWYCSVDEQTGAAQVDKQDAESLNLLKIDVLGLRTLSVIQDTLDQAGWSRQQIIDHPTDDKAAFKVINDAKYAGIFQFEGYALQSLASQLEIEYFEDIVSITALARPGPLNSGGATEFLKRRMGETGVKYLHDLAEEITEVTYGVVVYQEQVMQIARIIGGLSWEDVSSLRKAMSKSLGKEFFDQYWDRFKVGAAAHKIGEEQARLIWDNINTMGSWAFNRSHAVAYGMMSYWCCVLKAHFPLEFAAACLRNARDEDRSIKILRELQVEGLRHKPYDKEKSELNWSVQDGQLVGGLLGIKGVGPKTAADIIKRRESGQALTPRQNKLLDEGTTPHDMVFEQRDRWGHILDNPGAYGISSKITQVKDIKAESHGVFVIIAKLTEKNLRDHNEIANLQKRNGRKMSGPTLFLQMTVEDDSAPIICNIDRYDYQRLGVPLVDNSRLGQWYLLKGHQRRGFRKIYLKRWKLLTDNPEYAPKEKTDADTR